MAYCVCSDPMCDHGIGKRDRKAMILPGSAGFCSYCFTHCRAGNTVTVQTTARAVVATLESTRTEGSCDCNCWRCREGFGHCRKESRNCLV